MTGSGKTGFAMRYMANSNCACRFVFDDQGQVSARWKLPHASTATELESALESRWVVYNPHRMFPGDVAAAFRFFCHWVFEVSKRGPGKKIVLLDEVWQWCSPHAIPRELATIAQMGRVENLELLTATQLPHKLHASLTGQSTELVCFRLDEPLALARIQELGLSAAEIANLPLGKFIAINRLSRRTLAGKVF
jgi:hypothetical protein